MFWGQIALQSEGPLAFFWYELPPYLANNSKTTPLTPMLMKCDLYTQSLFKLTQDSSSHKGTPLPICTVTENHREVQFKLFPVEPLSGWGPRPLASLGSPCSRRVIGVLRDLQSHIGKVETGVRPAGNFLERGPKACLSVSVAVARMGHQQPRS